LLKIMLLHWNNGTTFNVIIISCLISMIRGTVLIEYSLIFFAVIEEAISISTYLGILLKIMLLHSNNSTTFNVIIISCLISMIRGTVLI